MADTPMGKAKTGTAKKRGVGAAPRKTKYQILQKAARRHCKLNSPASKLAVAEAKERYVEDAVKKGMNKKEAEKKARATMVCRTISGTRKTTTKKKK